MGVNPEFPGCEDVLFPVVSEEESVRPETGNPDSVLEDLPVRLQGTNHIGKHALVEVVDDWVSVANELEVGFVGIRNQNERIVAFEGGKQLFRNEETREKYRGPHFSKPAKVHLQGRRFAEIGMKFASCNLTAFVPANPGFVPKNFFKPVAGNRAGSMQSLNACLEVEVNQDFTKIEQKRFNLHS